MAGQGQPIQYGPFIPDVSAAAPRNGSGAVNGIPTAPYNGIAPPPLNGIAPVPLNGSAPHHEPTVQLPLPTDTTPPPPQAPPASTTTSEPAAPPIETARQTPPVEPTQPGPIASPEAAAPRRRRATKRRLPTQKIFSDLAAQAAIPAAAYAIGEDVDGAMCLVRTDEGFEVFNSMAGSRHEVRLFQDEESAYFYLFGVLVADAVRTGALAPRG